MEQRPNKVNKRLTRIAMASTFVVLLWLLALTLLQELMLRPLSMQVGDIPVENFYLSQVSGSAIPDRTIMLSNPSALPSYLIASKMTVDINNNLSGVEFATISNTVSCATQAYNGIIETSGLVILDPTFNYGYMFPPVQPVDRTYILISTNTGSANWEGQSIANFSTLTWYPLSNLSNYATIRLKSSAQAAHIQDSAVTWYNNIRPQDIETIVVGTAMTVGTGADGALYFVLQTPGTYRITLSGDGFFTSIIAPPAPTGPVYAALFVNTNLASSNIGTGFTATVADTRYQTIEFANMTYLGYDFATSPPGTEMDTVLDITFVSSIAGQTAMLAVNGDSGSSFSSYNLTCALVAAS